MFLVCPFLCTVTHIIGACLLDSVSLYEFVKIQPCNFSCHDCAQLMHYICAFSESVVLPPSGPGGIPPRGLLGDGPNDPRGGTLLSVTGEVIDPK